MFGQLKPITMKWWQLMIYESSIISLGIVIGIMWPELLSKLIYLFIAIFAIGGGYTLSTWWKQQNEQ